MGCDIHAHIEVKIGGRWEHYSVPSIPRCYELFEKICGVRGDVKNAISEPRGLPSDPSIVTMLDYRQMACDAHSETWLNGEEFVSLLEWVEDSLLFERRRIGYLFGNEFTPRDGVEAVRFICWFDN